MTTAVDLSRLPAPDVIETIDFEELLARAIASLEARAPELAAELTLESEPAVKVLQAATEHAVHLRARVNDAARAVLLPYATGADLDNLLVPFGIERLVVTPADPAAVPPRPAVLEDDASLRRRGQLAPDGQSVAGSRNAYIFHALSADGRIVDAAVINPGLGLVEVVYLALDELGQPTAAPTAAVLAACDADTVRPCSDVVTVAPAGVVPFDVVATLRVKPGPDASIILAEARARLDQRLAEVRQIGRSVSRSVLLGALHVTTDIIEIDLTSPAADLTIAASQVAIAGSVTLTSAVAT